MRSNFLKQKSAQVGEVDKENQSKEANKAGEGKQPSPEETYQPKPQKPAELSEEEKAAAAKKREEEAVEQMISRQKTIKQHSFMNLKGDYFKIY